MPKIILLIMVYIKRSKLLFGLTPLLAVVTQLLLTAVVNYIYEMLFPVTQPEVHGPSIFDLILLFALTEVIIGYFVSWIYKVVKKGKQIVLLIYSILYCAIGFSLGVFLGSYNNNMKEQITWAFILFVPTILYLVPYIYGTVRFNRLDC